MQLFHKWIKVPLWKSCNADGLFYKVALISVILCLNYFHAFLFLWLLLQYIHRWIASNGNHQIWNWMSSIWLHRPGFSWIYRKDFAFSNLFGFHKFLLFAADGAIDHACINWCALNTWAWFNDTNFDVYKISRFNFLEMCFVFSFSCRNMQMSCCCRWWLFMHKILWFNVLYIGEKIFRYFV